MSRARQLRQAMLFELDHEEGAPELDAPLELPLDLAPAPAPAPAAGPAPGPALAAAPARRRALAGAADLGAHLLAAGVATLGVALLDVPVRGAQAPGFALLLLVFSLFYTVVPLAFWGRTGGMALAGIACRGEDGQPPSFAEAARRWIGGLLTASLLGLPALPMLAGGRTLADRLGGHVPVVE